jgi:hypothetical protein
MYESTKLAIFLKGSLIPINAASLISISILHQSTPLPKKTSKSDQSNSSMLGMSPPNPSNIPIIHKTNETCTFHQSHKSKLWNLESGEEHRKVIVTPLVIRHVPFLNLILGNCTRRYLLHNKLHISYNI